MSKILVVDDEKDIVDLLSLHLQREGHEVHSVGHGLSVVPAAISFEPDLIVLDLMLPGIDGVQVHKRLRSDTRTRHIPVIMLTAKAQDKDVFEGYHYGADMYLTKPFNPMELVTFVKRIAQGKPDAAGPKRYDLD